ncbi:TRAP transporter substrate-binding protein [Piscinibacter sakaiensis]|uniref:TRAP transporter substrate-binding protein n=1 Tax=Piscinibacter sakaiensis TaxID=1547922 RepID=UPI003AAB32C3
MTTRRTLLAASLLAAMALPAAAQTEIKLGHVGGPGSLFELSANEFARRANEKLGNKAKVVVFGSSQIGGDSELMQKLRLGTVELAIPSSVMSSAVDAFGMFEMPYLVKSRDHMKKIEQAVVWPSLAPMAEAKGYKILAVWENGFRNITTNTKPIVKPEDLSGMKLRVPQGKWRVKMFQAYGANPSPMAFSEVFVALQTGVMDGQENPLTQIYSAKFQEVQKFLSMTGHVYTPAYLVTGKTKFASLPADVQKILADTAKETQGYVYEQAAKLDDDLLGKIKAAGVKVNEADKDAFIAASKDVYQEFAKEVPEGGKLVDKAIELGKGMK